MLARTPTPPPKHFQSQLFTPPPTDRKAKVTHPELDRPSPTPRFKSTQVSRKPNTTDSLSRAADDSLAIALRRPLALTSPSAARETLSFTADLDASDGIDEDENSGASDEGVLLRGVYARNREVRRMADEITEDAVALRPHTYSPSTLTPDQSLALVPRPRSACQLVPQLTEHVEDIDLTSHRPRRKREIVEDDDDDVALLGSSRPLLSPARPQVRRRIEPAVTVVEDDDPPLREISAGDAGESCGDCPTCGQSRGRLRGLGSKVLKPAESSK